MTHRSIPEVTLETLARTFYREAYTYGFGKVDYLRFINLLLDISMKDDGNSEKYLVDGTRKGGVPAEGVSFTELPLLGRHVKIRRFSRRSDTPLLKEWLADDYGRHFLLSCSKAREMRFQDLIADDANVIGVITLSDDTPIGAVAFLDYDTLQRKAELRKIIGEAEMREKGFAKEATRLWIQYGTEALGLKKIYLNSLNTNIRNIRLNEELGFSVEGILRSEVVFDDRRHDVLRMSLLHE